jgi:uncharacterized repeat protein (TIGR03803 family)
MEGRAVSLDGLVADDRRGRPVLWRSVEGLDLTAPHATITSVDGRPAHPPADPRILPALCLYATVEGSGSAREVARLCEEHTAFQSLRGGVGMNARTPADFPVDHVATLTTTESVARKAKAPSRRTHRCGPPNAVSMRRMMLAKSAKMGNESDGIPERARSAASSGGKQRGRSVMAPAKFLVVGVALGAATFAPPAVAATWQTLYSFSDAGDVENGPSSGLIIDQSGALYGTWQEGGDTACPYSYAGRGCGLVFRLTPPAAGQTAWTETTLYAFTGGTDGTTPVGSLLMDKSGALYGATQGSPANTLFKLTPPAAGQTAWTETTLHAFTGANGGDYPVGGLIMDNSGALYGTTTGGGASSAGVVFKLAPPAAGKKAWTETVLYAFTRGGACGCGGPRGGYPRAGVIMDNSGALYGTTGGGGTSRVGVVFRLAPPAVGQTAWTETVLHSFDPGTDGGAPSAGLIMDNSGALYGTTVEPFFNAPISGVVFKLSPPKAGKQAWTETVLLDNASFPFGGVIMDGSGALWGTTFGGGDGDCPDTGGCGTVFSLTPPARGTTAWTQTIYSTADGGGAFPYAGLVMDKSGAFYGTTTGGGAYNEGVVFQLVP